ncbi:Hsp20/alpha crystallin family protein [Crassaminicella profunda]|uniref:Hsp20/alpha crystallin family protein n=1 Tax=Crassaminicella profunda TaxID=1286698 RepID=UPI001CA69CDB|nr:Hsp20/alpha crystallin family protein [Crassaminicella profunda]QZY56018.1 Hsp20/alpha crystallin family protein [Crassaminicella profunda]
MHFTNQQISGTISNQLHFAPVSRTISNIGTTVTYSLNPSSQVSAHNTLNTVSGNMNVAGTNQFVAYPQTQWNQLGMNNVNTAINASQFNQLTSGGFISNTMIPSQGYYVRSLMVQPSIDISETTSDVVVTACVGNLGIHDVNLNVTDNSVTISGVAWTGAENVVLNRTVALPTSVRAEAIDANLQSGIMEIRCPKIEKSIRQRTTINADTIQAK